MNLKRSKKILSVLLFCLPVFFLAAPFIFAEETGDAAQSGDHDSVTQAQATMASLFGRGTTMPDMPRMKGSIAVPSFDSKNILIDEDAILETDG